MYSVEKYINPFTDFGFKKIFGNPDNTELLKSLLNDILGREGEDKIESIIFKNGELLPDTPEERKAIFDLFCEEGMKKGLEQGINQSNIEVAKRSLGQGLDIETIMSITGLSETEIEALIGERSE